MFVVAEEQRLLDQPRWTLCSECRMSGEKLVWIDECDLHDCEW
jgi:hypothetical protein